MVTEPDGGAVFRAAGGRRVLTQLQRHGLLLKQDKLLPSVVGLVTGQALTGSWWSHPQGQEIYGLLRALAERPDVLETKLLSGKVTFVFASLWSAWLGLATSAESWQCTGLSSAAQTLLADVNGAVEREATGVVAKELEQRLLVRTEQRHTASGKHVLVLESWEKWGKRQGPSALPVPESKAVLERAAQSLGAPVSALPWHARRHAG